MKNVEDGDVVVMLRQSVKRGGELMATYNMDYPNLVTALGEIAGDIAPERVESVQVGGRPLTDDELADLVKQCGGKAPSETQ